MSMTLGFGLYTSLFLFPQFVQEILGFTATQSGLVMLLAGLTEAVAIAFASILLRRPGSDPRWIIAMGMAVFAFSMMQMFRFTMVSAVLETEIAQLVRGFGLGAMVYCIDSTVLGSLQGAHEEQQGSALINLSRQLGGSFGIAVAGTYLVNMTSYHRTTLVSKAWSGSIELASRQQVITQQFVQHGYSLFEAKMAGLFVLNQDINLNATTMGFEDAFLLLGAVFVIALPAVILIHVKKVQNAL